MNTARGVPACFFRLQFELHVDSTDDEHVFLEFHLAHCLSNQPVIRRVYLERLQRSPEGSDQSTRRRRYDVIQSSSVRFHDFR